MVDATQRFSNRVNNYVKYRPRYPGAIVDTLTQLHGLASSWAIADIGAGTGFLSEPFLHNGNCVLAVEPNVEMRIAGETLLAHYGTFKSINGRAEATTLPDQSVEAIVVGQAFHWFDVSATRTEFQRILKHQGWVMLVWNNRITTASPFLNAYEQLLHQYCPDYAHIHQIRTNDSTLSTFFGQQGFTYHHLHHAQTFDYGSLQGRLLSSSYAPEANHPNHIPMMKALRAIFDQYAVDEVVKFEYKTEMYVGHLDEALIDG